MVRNPAVIAMRPWTRVAKPTVAKAKEAAAASTRTRVHEPRPGKQCCHASRRAKPAMGWGVQRARTQALALASNLRGMVGADPPEQKQPIFLLPSVAQFPG